MTRRTYALMLEEARALRSAGRHVIVDAVFAQETLRVAFAADAIVYMDTDEATVRERLGRRANSDAAISDAGLLEYEAIRALFEPPMNAVRLSDGGVVRALLDHL